MNQVRPPYAPPWFEFARFVIPDLNVMQEDSWRPAAEPLACMSPRPVCF